jgi:hypothetical protein
VHHSIAISGAHRFTVLSVQSALLEPMITWLKGDGIDRRSLRLH